MNNLVLLPAALIVYITLFVNMKNASKIRGNLFMGVTLPKEVLESELVKDIKQKYKKSCNMYLLISLISIIPIIFINKISLSVIYLMAWALITTMYIIYLPYKKCNRELKAIKKENSWYLGEQNIVPIDMKISRLKNQMPISQKYLIIPILLSIVPIKMSLDNMNDYGIIAVLVSIFLALGVGIFIYLFRKNTNMELKVYSKNDEINYAINKEEKYLQSVYLVISSILFTITNIIIFQGIFYYIDYIMFFALVPILITSIFQLSGSIYIKNRVTKLEEQLLKDDNNRIYTDEDEYWIDGVEYYNENDSRVEVRSRFLTGNTYNLATKKGRFIGKKLATIILVVILGPIFVMLLSIDFIRPAMIIDNNNKNIEINAPIYSTTANLDNIESIKLVNEIPKMKIRTNGAATQDYSLGNFRSTDLGKCKLYTYNENKMSIIIKLKNSSTNYIIYNERTPNKTEKTYQELQEFIKS